MDAYADTAIDTTDRDTGHEPATRDREFRRTLNAVYRALDALTRDVPPFPPF